MMHRPCHPPSHCEAIFVFYMQPAHCCGTQLSGAASQRFKISKFFLNHQ